MDQTQSQQVRVGLVISVALGILGAALFVIGQQSRFFEGKVDYEIHFARTGGLQKGAPVSLTGVPIGSVTDLTFPDLGMHFITVKISVSRAIAPRLRVNTVARIKTMGLLGDRFVELSAGTPDSPSLDPGAVIPSIDPIDVEALLGESGDIVNNVIQATAALKSVFEAIDRGEGLLGEMVKNRELGRATIEDLRRLVGNLEGGSAKLQAVMARIERGEGLIGELLRDGPGGRKMLDDLGTAASQLRQLTTRLNKDKGLIPKLVGDEAYAGRIAGNLERATSDLADILSKINVGDGTFGKLVNDPKLYHETKEMVANTRSSILFRLFGGLFAPGKDGEPPESPSSAESTTSEASTLSP